VLVIIAGGLGYKMYSAHQAEIHGRARELRRASRPSPKAKQVELEARLASLQKDTDSKLAKAQTEAERAPNTSGRRPGKRADIASARTSHAGRSAARTDEKPSSTVRRMVGKKDVSDNPLEGFVKPRRVPPTLGAVRPSRLNRARL